MARAGIMAEDGAPTPTNAHPAPHDAKRIASYSIRQRLTKRSTLFLAISHSARGMLYLCNVKNGTDPHRSPAHR